MIDQVQVTRAREAREKRAGSLASHKFRSAAIASPTENALHPLIHTNEFNSKGTAISAQFLKVNASNPHQNVSNSHQNFPSTNGARKAPALDGRNPPTQSEEQSQSQSQSQSQPQFYLDRSSTSQFYLPSEQSPQEQVIRSDTKKRNKR
jgi:patatin-like phospholipase/acyl hydrolase